ncbi:TlpA family protein disulfide reductase [Aestuariivirga sp.]|uniref:TlpA family protein disulfide reductase n=1 Tax=Aestuariivirga sp. TaxID=2650926 RepID=UPI0035939814
MSKDKKPGVLTQIGAGFAVIAAITGYYLFQADPRKAGPETAVAQATAALPAAMPLAGVTRELATGEMAAFLVKSERKLVPDIAFQDGTGKPVKLSDWKGRVVLVNLWATWCAPCRKEMPDLAKLQKDLGSENFEVLAISVDRKGAEASSAFLKETGADNLKLYVEPTTAIVNDLQAIGLPVTLLVDRQGNEIGRLIGPAHWAGPEAVALIKAALGEGA